MKPFIFSLICLASFSIRAQSGYSLQDCIDYALAHNIQLKQAQIQNDISKNNQDQSKAAVLPSINAGAAHIYNFGKTIDRFTNTFATSMVLSQNFYLSGQVTLWSGLTQYNNIKASEYAYLSGVESQKQMQNDLSLNVATAYISVIAREELLKISENQFQISKGQLERTLKLVEAGSQAKSVEYEIRAQLASDEASVTNADNNYKLALLSLQQLMNLDSVSVFKVQRPDISMTGEGILVNNVRGMYETSLKIQPSIKSAEYSILYSERILAAARGRRSPTLSFNASLGTGTSGLAKDIVDVRVTGQQAIGFTSNGDIVYQPTTEFVTKQKSFSDQFSGNVNKSLGFQLNMPIFNGLSTHTAVKNAKLNALNSKLSEDLSKQTLYKNIVQAQANARAALNTYNAYKASVESAKLSFEYAQQKFDAGVISVYDYNISKNKLFSAESQLLQAKYDYVFKLKVLDYYQGIPLGF
jgi:outer membrane protein